MEENESKIFLEELQKEKKAMEKFIKQKEDSIKENEIKYLINTIDVGNIFRGWEHIFTSKSNKIHIGPQIKKAHISNNEKLFSQTFDFQLEESINNDNKHKNINHSSNNNLKIDENKNNINEIRNSNSHNNNRRKINKFKSFIGVKRKGNSLKKELKHNHEEKKSD